MNRSDLSSLEDVVARLVSNLRKKGCRVGIEESLDATNALKLLPASDPELFSAAIRATLIKDFDSSSEKEEGERAQTESVIHGAQNQKMEGALPYTGSPRRESLHQNNDDSRLEFGIYSPDSNGISKAVPNISRIEEKRWSTGISRFKNSILTLEGHRFKRSSRGYLDPRRTMQLELRRAGDSPTFFQTVNKVSKANVALLCDVSGSMIDSNSTVVNMCYYFKRIIPKSEIFLFNTKLQRITPLVSRSSPGELARRIQKLNLGFGGGTKIGHCLKQFRMIYGDLVTSKTTVLIFSDGWDIGEIPTLRHEMKELQRKTHIVVWVNPFLDSKDYSADTMGMKTALEYIDVFISPRELLDKEELKEPEHRRFTRKA